MDKNERSDLGCVAYVIGMPLLVGAIAAGYGAWLIGAASFGICALVILAIIGENIGRRR